MKEDERNAVWVGGSLRPDPAHPGWYEAHVTVATVAGLTGHGRSRRRRDAMAFAFEDLARQLYQGPPREVRR